MNPIARTLSRALLPLLLLLAVPAGAVTVQEDAIPNRNLFGIQIGNDRGNAFYATAGSVRSMSMQTYVSAAFRVHEINIVTAGGTGMLRIYHSEVISPDELAAIANEAKGASGVPGTVPSASEIPAVKKMAGRASRTLDSVTSDVVFKDYPVATHAHTVEYRVRSLNELRNLYDQLTGYWLKDPEIVAAASGNATTTGAAGTTVTTTTSEELGLNGVLFVVNQ